MKLSEIYHMDIYSDAGQYLGDVQGIVVDLEKSEISRLLMVPWKNIRGDMKNTLRTKSVLYKNVKNVGDVVLVSTMPSQQEVATKEELSDLTK
jgi:sporulation protein YlmC with PRC-barrel domain